MKSRSDETNWEDIALQLNGANNELAHKFNQLTAEYSRLLTQILKAGNPVVGLENKKEKTD